MKSMFHCTQCAFYPPSSSDGKPCCVCDAENSPLNASQERQEPLERLFSVGEFYIYVQYVDEDPEYDFDYTIYDKKFDDVDGGLIGSADCGWDLNRAFCEIMESEGLGGPITVLDIEKYRDKLERWE